MQATIDGKQFSALSGMLDQHHRKLAKEGWFPPPMKGQYQAVACITGLIKYLRQRTDDPLKKENARLKNEILQHHLSVKRREFVKASEVQRELTRALVAFKTRVMAIPDAQAPRLALTPEPAEVKEILRRELIDALDELKKCEFFAGDLPPAPTAARKPTLPLVDGRRPARKATLPLVADFSA